MSTMQALAQRTTRKPLSPTVRYHVFRNYASGFELNEDEGGPEFFRKHPELRDLRYSMTAFCDRVVDGKLYLGCTHHAGDFLLEMDTESGAIRSLGYSQIYEPNEHKIHRGLWYDPADHALVFATSTLSPLDKLASAPPGKLVRYRIAEARFEIIGRNEPGQHAQATVYDAQRRLLYVFSYRAQKFGVFDVAAQAWRRNIFVDSIPHISALDDRGRCWSTYERSHRWCCFDPEQDDFVFFDKAMASAAKAANVMYGGAGPIDGMVNGGDGFLYVSTALAELYRLDPETAASRFLGRFAPVNRLPGLALGGDGWLYCAGGDRDESYLGRYHLEEERFEKISALEAPDGARCFRPHDLFIHGDRMWVAETDHRKRSGFVWEVRCQG